MTKMIRGSGSAWDVTADKYDFASNEFERERDTSRPIFYKTQKLNKATNDLEEVEMVKVTAPGETLCVFGGRVTQEHKDRWPEHYERFQRGESAVDGMPLSQWPAVANDIDFIDQMRAFRINTVEDMAKMNDSALRLFHGSLEWRKRAQVFLEQTNKAKEAEKIAADSSEKDRQIAELRASVEQLQATVNKPKGKPGRKAKQIEQTVAA